MGKLKPAVNGRNHPPTAEIGSMLEAYQGKEDFMNTAVLTLSLGMAFGAPAFADKPCGKDEACAKAKQACVRADCPKPEYLSKEAAKALGDLFKVALSSSSVEAASLFH